ncbi:MAG TPA: hypothetical protein VKR52_06265 [Terracidiphilus sp.]|nr:hypothetical protein [Terracidiphilus sp.]
MQQPSTQPALSTQSISGAGAAPSRRYEDLVYQAVTVASILLVLVSLWVF